MAVRTDTLSQLKATWLPIVSQKRFRYGRKELLDSTRQAPLPQDLLPAPFPCLPCPGPAPPHRSQRSGTGACSQAPPTHTHLPHVRPVPLTAASGQEPEPAARPRDRREPHSERSTCSDRGRGLSKPEEGPSSTPSPPHTNTYQPTLEAQLTWSFWMDDHV